MPSLASYTSFTLVSSSDIICCHSNFSLNSYSDDNVLSLTLALDIIIICSSFVTWPCPWLPITRLLELYLGFWLLSYLYLCLCYLYFTAFPVASIRFSWPHHWLIIPHKLILVLNILTLYAWWLTYAAHPSNFAARTPILAHARIILPMLWPAFSNSWPRPIINNIGSIIELSLL